VQRDTAQSDGAGGPLKRTYTEAHLQRAIASRYGSQEYLVHPGLGHQI
jgi:hypothetical protein